jgi:sigma-54 dependent transcriptional regulator, acetoin dehydrogenase operon transcriptional activator AcoR
MPDAGSHFPALPSRQELREVAAAWEAFMAGGIQDVENVRPIIRTSWERSQRLGVNPQQPHLPLVLTAEDIEALQEQTDLVTVATPVFETVTRAWEERQFMLSVSDRYGRILHTDGHANVVERARHINAIPGGSLAEEHIGTACPNVVIAQGRTEYVLWQEHYSQAFHSWAAIGAPIFHPLTHELIGVVCAAGEEIINPRALEIIERIAHRLEQLLHHEEVLRRVALLDAYHHFLLQHPHDIVLAVDGRGHICGATPAVAKLVEEPRLLLEKSLLRLPEFRIEGFHCPTQQQELHPYGVRLTRAQDGVLLNATAIPVKGARQPAGTLIVLPRSGAIRQSRAPAASRWRAKYTFTDLVGACSAFQDCLALARRAAQSDFPVLLTGESGAGKEVFAQAIHTASPRGQGPFVAVNCGVPGDDLLAVELFGYIEGAFTGALKGGRKGKIELAHGGTLFLDEAEAMSPKMQVSLLRALEEQHVVRVGGEHPVAVDIRVIAASNEDLRAAVSQKRFRTDLYHRLCVLHIQLPPLRERNEDIPLLARHLLRQLGFPHLRLAPEALQFLCHHPWPGNVRELKNVLLRAAQQTTGTVIPSAALPREVTAAEPSPPVRSAKSLRSGERDLIVQALTEARGSPTRAAGLLGIHRATLYRKLKRYGLFSPLKVLASHDS